MTCEKDRTGFCVGDNPVCKECRGEVSKAEGPSAPSPAQKPPAFPWHTVLDKLNGVELLLEKVGRIMQEKHQQQAQRLLLSKAREINEQEGWDTMETYLRETGLAPESDHPLSWMRKVGRD